MKMFSAKSVILSKKWKGTECKKIYFKLEIHNPLDIQHLCNKLLIYYNSVIFTEIKVLWFDAKIIFICRKTDHKTFEKDKYSSVLLIFPILNTLKKKKKKGAAYTKGASRCSDKAFELLEMKHILNTRQRINRRKNFG